MSSCFNLNWFSFFQSKHFVLFLGHPPPRPQAWEFTALWRWRREHGSQDRRLRPLRPTDQAKLALGNALRFPSLRSARAHDRGAYMWHLYTHTYTWPRYLYVIFVHAHIHSSQTRSRERSAAPSSTQPQSSWPRCLYGICKPHTQCVYVYLHTYILPLCYMYTRTHTRTHTHMCVYVYTYIGLCIRTHTHGCV